MPDAIAVPAGATLLFSSHAAGMQTYECQNGLWAFRAPKAALFDPQTEHLTGIHYGGIDRGYTAGPWWESVVDGSRIRGGNAKSAPSPNPASIPLLRLEVLERYGTGVFSPVSYIQRLNTEGGVGPTGKCGAGAQRLCPLHGGLLFLRCSRSAVVGYRGSASIASELLCEAGDRRPGQRVLDVEAGNGNATLAAARRWADVVSTNKVPALFERGRVRAEAEHLKITVREADAAEQLPSVDGSFDVVLSVFGVMFAADEA